MSHFTVLVPAKDDEDLRRALLPFHEYECTGIEAYLEFVDHTEEVLESWQNDTATRVQAPSGSIVDRGDSRLYREFTEEERKTHMPLGSGFGGGLSWTSRDWGDGLGYRARVYDPPLGYDEVEIPVNQVYSSIDEFAADWHGYIRQGGKYGRITNPNAKWDWYQVGGRWTGKLQLKSPGLGRNGKASWASEPNEDLARADIALAGDVDWKSMHDENIRKKLYWHRHSRQYLKMAEIADMPGELFEEAFKDYQEDGYRGDRRREIWRTPDAYAEYLLAGQLSRNDDGIFWHHTWDEIKDLYKEEAMFEAMQTGEGLTYAYIDLEGNWHQRGEMGWWGMDDPDKGTIAYDERWWGFVHSLPEDQLVYVVDCHI